MSAWRRCCIRQFMLSGNSKRRETPKQQSNFSSLSNSDLKTNVLSSDKSKAVKPTSKAHSTRCFKCHRIGHYANKCQKQRPLVTLENENVETEPEKEDPLSIFDDFTYEPTEGTKKNHLPFKKRTELRRKRMMYPGSWISPLEPTSMEAVKIYVHCLTHIFQTSRLLCMKSLGECSQLNYGTPRTRIRSNGVQMMIFSSREFGPYGSSSPRLDPYHHGPERPE
uniref:CCHC-type domain-containing protein n=1 Tax=Brassica oleracea TaxID=3712 RepID=A0A3P6CEE1_BRAOL|nr:unnamed protein product [Brassica oleracea]